MRRASIDLIVSITYDPDRTDYESVADTFGRKVDELLLDHPFDACGYGLVTVGTFIPLRHSLVIVSEPDEE